MEIASRAVALSTRRSKTLFHKKWFVVRFRRFPPGRGWRADALDGEEEEEEELDDEEEKEEEEQGIAREKGEGGGAGGGGKGGGGGDKTQ